MKQENMRDCVAAVAAMATNTTLEQFKSECQEHPDGGYSDIDFIAYCARHGVIAGGINYPLDRNIVREALEQGWVGVPMDQPAYVGVKSERLKGKGHSIYWDGKQVWDPNPEVPDGRPLLSYRIELWWPLAESSDGSEYLSKRMEILKGFRMAGVSPELIDLKKRIAENIERGKALLKSARDELDIMRKERAHAISSYDAEITALDAKVSTLAVCLEQDEALLVRSVPTVPRRKKSTPKPQPETLGQQMGTDAKEGQA